MRTLDWPHRGPGRLGLIAAAVTALSALAAPLSAQATVYDLNYTYDPADLTCGFFGQTGLCTTVALLPAPIATLAGDMFNIHVATITPIQVPGASLNSFIYVGAYDAESPGGLGAPGGVITDYQLSYTGLVTNNPAAPFSGPAFVDRTNDYIGFLGYFGQPHEGFSVTGIDAHLTAATADPRPIIALSVGYVWTPAGEVPEPATWATMILGFGAVGLVARRLRNPLLTSA
jgi:hypothetical protein